MRYSSIASCAIACLVLSGGLAGAQAPVQNQPSGSVPIQNQAPGQTPESRPVPGAQRQSEPAVEPDRRGEPRREGREQFDERRPIGDEGRREERRSTERDFKGNRGGRSEDPRYNGGYEERRSGGRYEERPFEDRRYRRDEDRRYGREEDRRYGRDEDRRYGRVERGYDGPRHLQISRRQRSRVHDVLVRRQVAPVNVDFPLRIGARIPGNLTMYDLPDEIYDYAPGYEGYRFFVTNDDVVIVDPETMEVIAVLEN